MTEPIEQGTSDVTRDGVRGARPGRDALTGVVTGRDGAGRNGGRRRAGRRGGSGDGRSQVPKANFTSYYGRPVLKRPVWNVRDIAGYLFLGGLAGGSSLLGAGARLTGRPALARVSTSGALAAAMVSLGALIHDLGRPARFLYMLRMFKVTSPMSVGTWLLSGYVPLTAVAAASTASGRARRTGTAAAVGAAALGPAVASYTAVLISDTAVPAWHDGHREMPFVFVASAASAAGGLGLAGAPVGEAGPARVLALVGATGELIAFEVMRHRMGAAAEPYSSGTGGHYTKAAATLTLLGACGALAGRRSRAVSVLSGVALLSGSAATRWGIFHAGLTSADDPRYTVEPQRDRLPTSKREAYDEWDSSTR